MKKIFACAVFCAFGISLGLNILFLSGVVSKNSAMLAFALFMLLNTVFAVFNKYAPSKAAAETFVTNEKTGVNTALTVIIVMLLFLWAATLFCVMVLR